MAEVTSIESNDGIIRIHHLRYRLILLLWGCCLVGCALFIGMAWNTDTAFNISNHLSCSIGEGTLIVTPHGFSPVESLHAGDEVFAYDPLSDSVSTEVVQDIRMGQVLRDIMVIRLGKSIIKLTPDHPVLVHNDENDFYGGLVLSGSKRWITASALFIGAELLSAGGERIKVTGISREEVDRVFNLVIPNQHTYLIGSEGIVSADALIDLNNSGYYSSSSGCFASDTLVQKTDGAGEISNFGFGDRVRTRNINQDRLISADIEDFYRIPYQGRMVRIRLFDETLVTTAGHPFWVLYPADRQTDPIPPIDVPFSDLTLPEGQWIAAADLKPGDRLFTLSGDSAEIFSVSDYYDSVDVYNIAVPDSRVYAVGRTGVLVHNKGQAESDSLYSISSESDDRSIRSKSDSSAPPSSLVAPSPVSPSISDSAGSFNTEEYGYIQEPGFVSPYSQPLSTFSIDVDTASYSNIRRMIRSGQIPVRDAVRIEEMINYFSYDYPEPVGTNPYSLSTEIFSAPWSEDHLLLKIGMRAKSIPFDKLPPNNLVFLLDVSGSMNSPDKLPLLKQSLMLLVEQMRPEDTVSLVVYAGAAGLVLPPTSCSQSEKIQTALNSLNAGGSTAGGAGIQLAYNVAQEAFLPDGNNRVILATDGDFNVGPSSEGELVRMIEDKQASGIYLSVLGFGTGNLKDSKMEMLADRGNGNYAYIDSLREAEKTLVKEMAGTLYSAADNVKIQIEFNPEFVGQYRMIGYENRRLETEDFDDDAKDAGEIGVGKQVTMIYEIIPPSLTGEDDTELRYQEQNLRENAGTAGEMAWLKSRYRLPGAEESMLVEQPVDAVVTDWDNLSEDSRFAAALTAFGLVLRDSEFRGNADIDLALELAEETAYGHEDREEFLGMVKVIQWLSGVRKISE